MPDLPLDEKALQEAADAAERYDESYYVTSWRSISQAAISTYLQEAGFEIEHDDGKLDFSLDKQGPRQRLVSPWLPIDQEEES